MATSSNQILINFGAITANFNSSVNNSRSIINNFNKALKDTQKTSEGLSSKLMGAAKGFLAFAAVKEAGEYLIKTRMEYEKMEAALSATVGPERVAETFKALQQFAKDTPYDLASTTKAYQRLVNLGLDPSREALLAYGNIAATVTGKSILDVVEAVADGATGEYERLKEFGMKVNAQGEKLKVTFQGQTHEVEKTGDAFEKFAIKMFAGVANGKAMENQSKTLSGRLAALGDSFEQLVNNINKFTGTNDSIGGVVNSISDAISRINESFDSGEAESYWEAFKAAAAPVPDLINSIWERIQGLKTEASSGSGGEKTFIDELFPESQIDDLIKQLTGFFNEIMGYVNLLNSMVKDENFFTYLSKSAEDTMQPITDLFVDLNNKVIELTSSNEKLGDGFYDNADALDDFKTGFEIFDDFKWKVDDIGSALTGTKFYFQLIPLYVKEAFGNAMAAIRLFARGVVAEVRAIYDAIRTGEFDITERMNKYKEPIYQQYRDELSQVTRESHDYIEKIITSNDNLTKSFKKVKEAAEFDNLLNGIMKDSQVAMAESKRVDQIINDLAKDPKDDPLRRNGRAAQGPRNNSGAGTTGAKKGGRGGAASQKANQEYLQMLRNQEAAEEDSYKRGEVSIRSHYAKMLQLKLAQLQAEGDATTNAVNKNNEIIADSASTEKQKQNAINSNIEMQNKMNGITEKEKGIREEIARNLRDAQQEYKDMVLGLRSDLEELMGGINFDTAMKNFEKKYRETRAKLKTEDKENGTNYTEILDQIQKISEAQYKIADSARARNVQEAEYKALNAELNYQIEAGLINQNTAKQQQLATNKQMIQDNITRLQQELDIANATKGYDPIKIAELRQNLAEAKTTLLNFNEDVKTVKDAMSESFEGFFKDIATGTKSIGDAFNDLADNILSSINSVISKNLANALMNSLFGATEQGTGGGGGLSAGIGSIISSSLGSLFGGAFAKGGSMPNGTWNLVGENGPELVHSGNSNSTVFSNQDSKRMLSGRGNMYFNITSPDANSFRKSEQQIQVEMQRKMNRAYNRNS